MDGAFAYSLNLSFPDRVHRLVSADCAPRYVEAEEPESGIDSSFGRVGRQRVVLMRISPVFFRSPVTTMALRYGLAQVLVSAIRALTRAPRCLSHKRRGARRQKQRENMLIPRTMGLK